MAIAFVLSYYLLALLYNLYFSVMYSAQLTKQALQVAIASIVTNLPHLSHTIEI